MPDVDHVVMFDFPLNPIDYLHRSGIKIAMHTPGYRAPGTTKLAIVRMWVCLCRSGEAAETSRWWVSRIVFCCCNRLTSAWCASFMMSDAVRSRITCTCVHAATLSTAQCWLPHTLCMVHMFFSFYRYRPYVHIRMPSATPSTVLCYRSITGGMLSRAYGTHQNL